MSTEGKTGFALGVLGVIAVILQLMYPQIPIYIGWPVIGLFIIGTIILFMLDRKKHQSLAKLEKDRDEGLILLELLDEVYQRLKLITRLTIRKMRSKDWKDVTVAYPYLMGLTDLDVESAIESIMIKNIFYLTTGKPMTIEEDGKQLAEQIKQSPLFTRNPEHIVKDASVILREKVPYLKKKLDHDHKYKKLLNRIERERDKFPSEAVSNVIDDYLEHSVKINAAWVLSTYDLDHLGEIEEIAGRQFPMKLKVILWGLPGRMDEEMRGYRNKVAIAVLRYHKEETI